MKNKHTHLLLNKLEPTIHVAIKFAKWEKKDKVTIDLKQAEELLKLVAAADQELELTNEL
jgi:hypothetical protein